MKLRMLSAVSTFLIATTARPADFPIVSYSMSQGTQAGSVSNLIKAGDAKVFRFYTSSKGNLTVTFNAKLNASGSPIFLISRFKQNRASDTFDLSYQNASKAFVSLGRISGSAGIFQDVRFAVPQTASVNGSVVLRLRSNSGADDGQIDQLILTDGSASASPPAVPAPVPPSVIPPPPTLPPVPATAGASFPAGASWYWQLQGALNLSRDVQIYNIDLFDTPIATIQNLKASGKTLVCYFSAGSYENWRTDASQFPSAALGNNLSGWPGERWLDVRNPEVLNIMARRMDLAKSKGCDALEPDNVDGYSNNAGFPLTANDQVAYLQKLAAAAHARGLKIALKNATDLVGAVHSEFDFAVVEECFKYNECQAYTKFTETGKAVLNAEYTNYSAATCSTAKAFRFSTTFYNLALDGTVYQPCQ